MSLLTALPALSTMLLSIPSGEFLSGRNRIVPWYAWTRFISLVPYGLVGLVPFLFHDHRPEIIVVIWALSALPQGMLSITFNMVMAAIAGPGGRIDFDESPLGASGHVEHAGYCGCRPGA